MYLPEEVRFFTRLGDLLEQFRCHFHNKYARRDQLLLEWKGKYWGNRGVVWPSLDVVGVRRIARGFMRQRDLANFPERYFCSKLASILDDARARVDPTLCLRDELGPESDGVFGALHLRFGRSSPAVNCKGVIYLRTLDSDSCYKVATKLLSIYEDAWAKNPGSLEGLLEDLSVGA